MKLRILDAHEYEECCKKYQYFYNSMQFHELNKEKVERVEYLLFEDTKKKLAITIGIKDNMIKIPYSAPFGMFEKLQKHIRIEDIDEALNLLNIYAKEQGITSIMFRMPPSFYDETCISKLQNSLLRQGYVVDVCDLNYQFFIDDISKYQEKIMRNAKKNLKNAMKNTFRFVCCNSIEQKYEAYKVIEENRQRKGYPLRMTWEQVKDTMELTPHDCFLLKEENTNVAAAVVFQVTEGIYQVIYWGDIAGYEEKRPMNLLAYRVYEYYSTKAIQVLDIGPSTEDGIPNYGLCDFKESIGCDVSSKYTFVKHIEQ